MTTDCTVKRVLSIQVFDGANTILVMNNILDFVKENVRYLAVGAAVLGTVLVVVKRRKRTRVCGVDYPRDKVIMHVFPRYKNIPNMGHFAMKLETYLRVNNIPYEIDFNYQGGPKSKFPWIEYNGVTMGDSQLIMQYLNEKFHINMDEHLSKEEKAVAWAIQKWLEEYTYWLNVHTRWVIFSEECLKDVLGLGALRRKIFQYRSRRRIASVTYTVGVGRHSEKEVHDFMVYDLRQFAVILGNKQYVMGDKITEVDCAAFGVLVQVRWGTPSSCPGHQLLTGGELQNVMDYLDRIKNKYWRDWEQLLDEARRP